MEKALFDLVKKYDVITLYRHVSPDSDALGSQFGLKQWILDTYPSKRVYALGTIEQNNKNSCYPVADEVDDETVKQSLAIILDTANTPRVDDQRFKIADYRLKIDHHIVVEEYAEASIVDPKKGATCEILARLFEQEGYTLSAPCAQYLYGGLIADTLRFSIQTTSANTLRAAAYLVDCGANVTKANEDNFSTSLEIYQYENFLRSKVQVRENKLAYCIVCKEEYDAFGLTFNEAKDKVYVMGGVHEFESWILFTEKERNEDNEILYSASLRSKRTPIDDIANKYGGGGHHLACGCRGLTMEDVESILKDILERI